MRRFMGITGTSVEGITAIGAHAQCVQAVPVPQMPAQAEAVQARIQAVFRPPQSAGSKVIMLESALVMIVMAAVVGHDVRTGYRPKPQRQRECAQDNLRLARNSKVMEMVR